MTQTRQSTFAAMGLSQLRRLQTSNYDISNICNLRCEGCLYFSGAGAEIQRAENDIAKWDAFFAQEAERGVNFAYIAGAEPSLAMDRIMACHRHIPLGVVFSNGTKRIPDDISYRIHISIWGDDTRSELYRGASLNQKAMRNYAGDPRAVFVMTLNALNLGEIDTVARACADHGVPLTFSLFSPTLEYNDMSVQGDTPGVAKEFFSFSAAGNDMRFDGAGLAAAREAMLQASANHPQTVKVNRHYLDWVTAPGSRYQLDEDGVALDCRNRLTKRHRHYNADLSRNSGKCCSPNLDCAECRPYAMSLATFLTRRDDHPEAWQEVWRHWAELFLSEKTL